jgi:hypothetical protein
MPFVVVLAALLGSQVSPADAAAPGTPAPAVAAASPTPSPAAPPSAPPAAPPSAAAAPATPAAPAAPASASPGPASAPPTAPPPDAAPEPAPTAPPVAAPVPEAPPGASPGAAPAAAVPPPAAPPLPRADQASGLSREEPTGVAERLLWIPRVLFFVPRWTFWAVAQPLRLSAWAYERYSLPARLKGALFNVDGTYGVYPVASYSTDFGLSGGLRFVHYDLAGRKEHLKLRGNFGGRFQQAYGFSLDSGQRFGDHLQVELDARYERRPSERFFGIGNADRVSAPPPGELADPAAAAIQTRFRESLLRVLTTAKLPILRTRDSSLSAYLSSALMLRTFSSDYDLDDDGEDDDGERGEDDDDLASIYDVSRLAGFTEGVDNLYVEAELVYDSRRQPSRWQSRVVDATGWYAAAHLGRGLGVAGDPSAFTRYGGELVRFFDLYRGSRVLALRLFLEGATGGDGPADRALPFIDLPRLGGPEYLRGYPEGRFRDRVVALGTAEYTWDLGNMLAAYTFLDVGRPSPSLAELELDGLRYGFGGGVQLHSQDSFIARVQLAGSAEGDFFFELVLSPAFGRRERAGRY